MIVKFLKPFSFLPAILLMYMIYSFSSQDGATSASLSYQVSYKIVEVSGEVLGADLQPWEVDQLATRFHIPVRKLAHMTEYFLLALAVAFPLYVYGLRGILLLFAAGMICVGFACGDEYHQAYVDGRGPSRRDVLIDSVGVFFGIIIVRIIGWTGRNLFFRPSERKVRKGDAYYPQSDPYVQGRPYPQDNPYPQSRPYPQGNPYPQNRPYPQGNPYPQSKPYPQGSPYPQSGPYPQDSGPRNPYFQDGSRSPQPQGYYDRPSRGTYPQESPDFYYEEEDEDSIGTSDRLSEDMSFRKLVNDLKEQKQARHHTPDRQNADT